MIVKSLNPADYDIDVSKIYDKLGAVLNKTDYPEVKESANYFNRLMFLLEEKWFEFIERIKSGSNKQHG